MGAYDDVFAALDAAAVRFVVVGGVAVVLQGHPRMTVDLDLVVELETRSVRRSVEALLALGFVPRLPVDPLEFADAQTRRSWVEGRNLQVFSFYDPTSPLREVDLFADYPLPFEELCREARTVLLGGVPVAVASIAHLIAMKTAAGRPQDRADIAALTAMERDG